VAWRASLIVPSFIADLSRQGREVSIIVAGYAGVKAAQAKALE